MQLKIKFDHRVNPMIYEDYSRYLFRRIRNEIKDLSNKYRKKYLVREPLVLESSVIKWDNDPPKSIDLIHYIQNCLEIIEVKGFYVIRLNKYKQIIGSSTPVEVLIRLLEYGNEKVPSLPLIRGIFSYYKKNYKYLFNDYAEKEWFS